MDNTTNGGNDKRNWRERLGIGTNGLPKAAEDAKPVAEAKPAAPLSATPAVGAIKMAPRPQPVTKPAPMAPRPATKPVAATPVTAPAPGPRAVPAPVVPVRPVVQATVTPARPLAKPAAAPVNTTSPEGLANRLKAQREAAEKLAEQRIQMARQRAEAARQDNASTAATSGRPKFTFADEESKAAQANPPTSPVVPPATTNLPPPLVRTAPPRPVLGGDAVRPVAPPRPAAEYQPPPPPNYAPRQPNYTPPYRPVDPVTGYAPPAGGNRSFVPPLAQLRPAAPLPPRLPPIDPEADFGYAAPPLRQSRPQRSGQPLSPRSMPQPTQTYAEGEEIFEQSPPRRSRRPTAEEYAQAYRDTPAGYDEYQEPQQGSPWWILVSALVLLAAAVGGYMFYSNYVSKQVATQPTTTTPVVTAPEQPAKVQPEQAAAAQQPTQPAGTQPQAMVAKPTKKQIYDRIVGDKEIVGSTNMVPTEEIPVQPDAGTQAVVPAGQAVPDTTAPPGTVDQGAGDTAPLPVPPPPGTSGQQGQLQQPPDTATKQTAEVAPAASESEAALLPADGLKKSTADPANVAVDDVVPTPTEKLAAIEGTVATPTVEQVPQVPGTPAVAATQPAVTAPVPEAQLQTPVTPPAAAVEAARPADAISDTPDAKPVVLDGPTSGKVAAKPKQAKRSTASPKLNNLGARPVVLVPPNGQKGATPTVADNGLYGDAPATSLSTGIGTVAPAPKKRTLSDLFKQQGQQQSQPQAAVPLTTVVPTQPVPQTQVAAVQPKQVTPQQAQAPAGNGYVVQLASFRSRAEANQEYARLRGSQGAVIGSMAPVVTESSIGGSTRYRLGLGPVDSRATASQVCSRLISAGERDCVVTRQ
jgi:cell division septation protein DedD